MTDRRVKQSSASVTVLKQHRPIDESVLIPPGLYQLAYKRHNLVTRFNRGVLELRFAIVDFGSYFDLELPRYYNVSLSDKRSRFSARPQSDFVLEYCALFGQRPNFRRSPLKSYEANLVEGLIQSVTKDHRQKNLPIPARYSTIRELRRVI